MSEMTIGYINGNELVLEKDGDTYATDEDGNFVTVSGRPVSECGRCGLEQVKVTTCDGEVVTVDGCLGPLVRELNKRGVDTTSCCCGHGMEFGYVSLGKSVTLDLDIIDV